MKPDPPDKSCAIFSSRENGVRTNQPQLEKPQIADHELLRRIGGGSYGEVWLARNAIGSLHAVKIIYRNSFPNDRPFEREFEGIQKAMPVSRAIPGLVQILHVGRNDAAGYFYYVMELADEANTETNARPHPGPLPRGEGETSSARRHGRTSRNIESRSSGIPSPGGEGQGEGGSQPSTLDPLNYMPRTLQSETATRGALPVEECVALGLTLTEALGQLHAQGLVHRDIKPSNIIFVRGAPKLADIGLMASASEAQSFVGTAGFIPPEGPGTPQADLYSLGKVLYEISTGKDRQEFPQLPGDLAEQSDAPQLIELNAVILKACQPDPRKRYESAAEMHVELALLQRGKSVKSKRTWERRWTFGKRLALSVGALVLLFVVIQQLVLWRETKTTQSTTRHKPKNAEAIRFYEQARLLYSQLTDDFRKAHELLDRAIKLEPEYVDAYVLRSEMYVWTFTLSRLERAAKTREVADKLMAIDSSLGEAHTALAWSELCEFKWEESEKEFKTAIRLCPNYAVAHSHYALFLWFEMRLDEARSEFKRALELDSTSRMITHLAAYPDFAERNYDKAIAQFQKALDLENNFRFSRLWMAKAYEEQGKYPAAIAAYEKMDILAGKDPAEVAKTSRALRKAYDEQGERGYWQAKLDTMKDEHFTHWPGDKARIYAHLGDKTNALDWLEKAFDTAHTAQWLKVTPWWDGLREEPRFKELLRRARLDK